MVALSCQANKNNSEWGWLVPNLERCKGSNEYRLCHGTAKL